MSIVILVPSSWMVNSRIKDSDYPFGVIWYHWGTPKSNGDHIQILWRYHFARFLLILRHKRGIRVISGDNPLIFRSRNFLSHFRWPLPCHLHASDPSQPPVGVLVDAAPPVARGTSRIWSPGLFWNLSTCLWKMRMRMSMSVPASVTARSGQFSASSWSSALCRINAFAFSSAPRAAACEVHPDSQRYKRSTGTTGTVPLPFLLQTSSSGTSTTQEVTKSLVLPCELPWQYQL